MTHSAGTHLPNNPDDVVKEKNEIKQYILGNDAVFGIVYHHPKYGRTIVLTPESNAHAVNIRLIDAETLKEEKTSKGILEFYQSMVGVS